MKFFKPITIGQYIHKDSLIHRLDPRIKIMVSIIFIAIIFLIKEWNGFLIVGVYLFSGIILSKIHPKFVLKGLKPVFFIIALTLMIHVLTTPGRIFYQIAFFKMTLEGLERGLFIACRLFSLILTTSWLTLTTSPIVLTDGIERLLSIFKFVGIPSHEIAMMMTIALRFIPTLMEETEKIIKAQVSRGADFDTSNLIKKIKNIMPIIIPLFVSAFRRADDLAIAMEARCYRGGIGRTHYRNLSIKLIDYCFAIITLIILFFIFKYYR